LVISGLVSGGVVFVPHEVEDVGSASHNYYNCYTSPDEDREQLNDRPIIGVLAQELGDGSQQSYIAASYVKYLEMAGARVVPVQLLIPGGAANITTSGYGKAARILYSLAEVLYGAGDYWPIWGTCLGFEFLVSVDAGTENILSHCRSYDKKLPLYFTKDAYTSKLFGGASDEILRILQEEEVTSNYHSYCATPEDFQKFETVNNFTILSTNMDENGIEFVSTIEHKTRPIYGTQWHPEKNNFEWNPEKLGIPHSFSAIRICQYMANFFVNECKRNHHGFSNIEDEKSSLIYNYSPVYTDNVFTQTYLFNMTRGT